MQKVKLIAAILLVGFVISLVIFNATNPVVADATPWNEKMTKGNRETGTHFVMYTDIFCPHCDKFSNALHANIEDFHQNYIDNGKVFYEMRVTDNNYHAHGIMNSRKGGETAYCAASQDKFWPYYQAILDKLFADYHSKGIGIDKDAEKIPELENDYFYEAAATTDLDQEAFKNCLESHEALPELNQATEKASRVINGGVPFFVFGTFKTSGFAGNWDPTNDYRQAKLMLNAGL